MPVSVFILRIALAALCNSWENLGQELPRRSFLARRAIDGTRGRKYFDPQEEDTFDSYGSAGGQYDPNKDSIEFSDIRGNVPGEPGVDFPAYRNLPQTGFTCEGRSRGYYADEAAGCQVFHVCHDILVSSFLCPIGSIFSQKLLTCDWWNKVDCSSTQDFVKNSKGGFEQADDDDMIRKAYVMMSLQPGDEAPDVPVDPDQGGTIPNFSAIGKTISPLNLFHRYYEPRPTNPQEFSSSHSDYGNRPNDNRQVYSYHLGKGEDQRHENARTEIQDSFYFPSVEQRTRRPPYQDSPIIRIHTIGDSQAYRPGNNGKPYENSYRKSEEYHDGFQASYAPTVPTVTTTTRKFYSPTVPMPPRSSTPSYNQLYQRDYANSDSHFAQSQDSRSFATEPTIVRHGNEDYPAFYDPGETESVSRNEEIDEESYDDFEIRESIGLVRAVNDRPEKISLQAQSPKEDDQTKRKNDWSSGTVRANSSNYFQANEEDDPPLSTTTKTLSSRIYDDGSADEYLVRSTNVQLESESSASTFGRRTTPLVKNSRTTLKQNYATIQPVTSNSNYSTTTEKYVDLITETNRRFDETGFNRSVSEMDVARNSSNDQKVGIATATANVRENPTRELIPPKGFLEPPFRETPFHISVPDFANPESTTFHSRIATSTTPETVIAKNEEDEKQAFSLDEKSGESRIDGSQGSSKGQSAFNKSSETTTPNSLLSSVQSPSREIALPFETYNHGQHRFFELSENVGIEPFNLTIEGMENLKDRRNQTEVENLGEFPTSFRPSSWGSDGAVGNNFTSNFNLSSLTHNLPLIRNLGNLEVVRSVERNPTSTDAYSVVDTVKHNSDTVDEDFKSLEKDLDKPVFDGNRFDYVHPGKINIAQLMAELFNTDRLPRPFSLKNSKNIELQSRSTIGFNHPTATIISKAVLDSSKPTISNIELNNPFATTAISFPVDDFTDKFDGRNYSPTSTVRSIPSEILPNESLHRLNSGRENINSPSGNSGTPGNASPLLKDQILQQLTKNFGRPVYRAKEDLEFELPDEKRSVDFKTVELSSNFRDVENSDAGITALPKVIVETEFVPALGFSLDDDQEREKYAETLVGGFLQNGPSVVNDAKNSTKLPQETDDAERT